MHKTGSLCGIAEIDRTWSSCCGTVETNLTRNYEVMGSIPGLAQVYFFLLVVVVFFVFGFVFLGSRPQHVEVPRLGVKLEL